MENCIGYGSNDYVNSIDEFEIPDFSYPYAKPPENHNFQFRYLIDQYKKWLINECTYSYKGYVYTQKNILNFLMISVLILWFYYFFLNLKIIKNRQIIVINCIIIDNDGLSRKAMKHLVSQVDILNLVGVCSNAGEAITLLNTNKVDLLAL